MLNPKEPGIRTQKHLHSTQAIRWPTCARSAGMQTLSWQWGQTGLGHLHFLTHFPGNPQDKAVARME